MVAHQVAENGRLGQIPSVVKGPVTDVPQGRAQVAALLQQSKSTTGWSSSSSDAGMPGTKSMVLVLVVKNGDAGKATHQLTSQP